MCVRFITPWWEVRRGVHYGLFGPAYECAQDREVPWVLREALWTEIDWFEANLPVPARRSFLVKSRRRFRADGICWFTDGAREAIARAFTLAALLRECGVPVSKVATHRPGQILYRDDYQIVAKPDEATPTVWH
jgi:sulfur carrier protein ThiS